MNKQKILIVEDEEGLLFTLKLKFTKAGYQVFTAMDGEEGLKAVKKEMPDIILLDLLLPKIDGFEFLKQIKKDNKLKKIPVIIISNLAEEEYVDKGMKLGATDHFAKTKYSLDELVKTIEAFLNTSLK